MEDSSRKPEASVALSQSNKNIEKKTVQIKENDVVCHAMGNDDIPTNHKESPEMLALITHPGNQALNLLLLQQAANFSTTTPEGNKKRLVAANMVADEVYLRGGNFINVVGHFHTKIPDEGYEMTRDEAIQMINKRLEEVSPENCRPIGETQHNSPSHGGDATNEAETSSVPPPSKDAPAVRKPDNNHKPQVCAGACVRVRPDDIIVASENSKRVRETIQENPGNKAYMRTLNQYASRLAARQDNTAPSFDVMKEATKIAEEISKQGRMFIIIGKIVCPTTKIVTQPPETGRLMSQADAIRRIKSDIKVAVAKKAAILAHNFCTTSSNPHRQGVVGRQLSKNPLVTDYNNRPSGESNGPTTIGAVGTLKAPTPSLFGNGPAAAAAVMGTTISATAKPLPADPRDPASVSLKQPPPNPPEAAVGSTSGMPAAHPMSISLKPPPSYSLQNGLGSNAWFPPAQQDRTPRKPKRKISTHDIEVAIPPDASSIFHVFDRRVDLDAHDKDASLYSLLRSWVQDDPYRKMPAAGLDIQEFTEYDGPVVKTGTRTTTSTTSCGTKKNLKSQQAKCDIVSELNGFGGATYSTDELRANLIKKARRVKRQKCADYKRRDAEAVAMLKQRGIHLQR